MLRVRASLVFHHLRGPIDLIKLTTSLAHVNIHSHTGQRMLKTAAISYRIPAELKAALQKLADADKRKLGPYIQIVLEEHVATKKPTSKRK